jgi:hypothetical protein
MNFEADRAVVKDQRLIPRQLGQAKTFRTDHAQLSGRILPLARIGRRLINGLSEPLSTSG